jgi:hypothetical protein
MGKQLVVPASAALQSGTSQIVFVDRDDGYLEPREVQLGSRAGDDFVVSPVASNLHCPMDVEQFVRVLFIPKICTVFCASAKTARIPLPDNA